LYGRHDHFGFPPQTDPTPLLSSSQSRKAFGMSIELIFVIIVLLLAAGITALRKRRTGSFAPWWWRSKGNRDA
jgi:hypothetical protein